MTNNYLTKKIIFGSTILLYVGIHFASSDGELNEFDNSTINDDVITVPPIKAAWMGKEKQNPESNVYYAEDGRCAWWNGNEYEPPKAKYVNAVRHNKEGANCLHKFHNLALQPLCNDPFHQLVKHCAQVSFYGNKVPAEESDVMKNLLLAIVGGCAICTGEIGTVNNRKHRDANFEVTVELVHTWDKGSLFTKCSVKEKMIGSITFKLDKGNYYAPVLKNVLDDEGWLKNGEDKKKTQAKWSKTGSFVFPALLYQRKCRGLFGYDDPQEVYKNVKLRVKHNCPNGHEKDEFEIDLPNLDPKDFKNKFVEIQGLVLMLKEKDIKWYQYQPASLKYRDGKHLPGEMPLLGNHV